VPSRQENTGEISLESLPAWKRCAYSAAYKLASRTFQEENTVVRVEAGNRRRHRPRHGRTLRRGKQGAANAGGAAGARCRRHNIARRRFQAQDFAVLLPGLEEEGLKLLAEAREETGLLIVTEVMDVRTVPMVAQYADILQIGARNMQNFFLLREVAKVDRPVVLKRSPSGTIEEC
jgi:3-deoxy-7-phosphoheptulonate synthase